MEQDECPRPWMPTDAVDALRRPFDSRCWWCGSTDLSAEHRFKRSDLSKLDASKGGLDWIDSGTGVLQRIRGPQDKRIKFEPNLCKRCNNARSQPSDRAWDLMFDYIAQNWYRGLRRSRTIDFANILGDAEEPRRVAQYLVKNMACTIVSSGFAVPPGIISFLDDDPVDRREIQSVFFRCRSCWEQERNVSKSEISSLARASLYAELDRETMEPNVFATEFQVGAFGFMIRWDGVNESPPAFFEVDRATIHDRRSLPDQHLHCCVRDRFMIVTDVRGK